MELIGELAGYVAAILATLTFLPQVIKTIRSGDSKGLSTATLALSFSGNLCWLLNGLAYNNSSLIFSGLFIMLLLVPLFYVKYKNDELISGSQIQEFVSNFHFFNLRTDP